MPLSGRFVSISGSASPAADLAELARAHRVVRALTKRVLELGGGLVEVVGRETRISADDPESATTFFWTMVEEILASGGERTTPLLRAVCNVAKLHEHVPEHRRELWAELRRRGWLELRPTEEGMHSGGEIRRLHVETADLWVLVGGGKGTYELGVRAVRDRRPVLAFDTGIGAAHGDGEGSLSHHRSALRESRKYVPHEDVETLLPRLSLRDPSLDPDALARAVIDVLARAPRRAAPVDAVLLTVVNVELDAAHALLGVREDSPFERTPRGTVVRRVGGVAVACIGRAGNATVGPVVADLLTHLQPQVIVLCGIAGGDPERTKIGEVIIADQVIGYEPAAVVGDVTPREDRRPAAVPIEHASRQLLTHFVASGPETAALRRTGAAAFPLQLAPIAAGEKLVRSEAFFTELQKLHPKVRAVEMEAHGFVEACTVAGVQHFVVRGISDHANEAKADAPQRAAATNAVAIALELVEYLRAARVGGRAAR